MARSSPIGRSRGFAYVLLLAAIAVIGMAAAMSVSAGSAAARRGAEQELLAIGMEFQRALNSYAGAVPGSVAAPGQRGPRSLDDLLKDPRTPGIRRHLRKLYADPLTGKAEWGLLLDDQGFIVAVHSLADGQPLQRTGFPPELAHLEEAGSYRDWRFGLNVLPVVMPRQRP